MKNRKNLAVVVASTPVEAKGMMLYRQVVVRFHTKRGSHFEMFQQETQRGKQFPSVRVGRGTVVPVDRISQYLIKPFRVLISPFSEI